MKTKDTSIDALRIMSMLGVIVLHSIAPALRVNLGTRTWWLCILLASFFTMSVNIFFMISGANLLSSENTKSISYLFKKRLPKLIIPLFFWSLVAVLVEFTPMIKQGSFSFHDYFMRMTTFFQQPAALHLWFMYTLIPLYLLSPVLKYLVDVLPEKIVKYLFVIWIIMSVLGTVRAVIPEAVRPLLNISFLNNLTSVNGYLGAFFFGYYLYKQKNTEKNYTKMLIPVFILSYILIIGLTAYYSLKTGAYSEMFTSYRGIFVTISSVSAVLIMQKIKISQAFAPCINFIASLSFGVYLIHNIIISCLYILGYTAATAKMVAFIFFAALLLSLLVIFVCASIKPLCYIATGLAYKTACKCCNIVFLINRIKAVKPRLKKRA